MAVQMGGVSCDFHFFKSQRPGGHSDTGGGGGGRIAVQIADALQYFLDKVYGLGVPKNIAQISYTTSA